MLSSKKLSGFLPDNRRQRFGLLTLLVLGISIGFVFSYTLAQKNAVEPKMDDISSGQVADKDGKVVYEVQLRKENKDPIDLLIKKGESVQFNSKDGGQHQIVQGGHGNTTHGTSSLDSGVFNNDEGYLLEFKETGKYDFHDNYDHDYTITVIVYDPDKKPEETKIQ